MVTLRERLYAAGAIFFWLAVFPSPTRSQANVVGTNGPVRLAWFSDIQGDIHWRPDADSRWSSAVVNLPLQQGAQIEAGAGGSAEVFFDDGSAVRIASGTTITLKEMYSDSDGEFTQITLPDGLASLHVRDHLSVFQIDTPAASLQAVGPAAIRMTAANGTQVSVTEGTAKVEDDKHQGSLTPGQAAAFATADAPLTITSGPPPDAWDTFVAARDHAMTPTSDSAQYLPPQLALVAGDLDAYGTWHKLDNYGEAWLPKEPSDWIPYHDGRWVWVDNIGWTWVGDEPWGWVPYHYGTWTKTKNGWAWVPGPDLQYWSPAVVDITDDNGQVSWTPWAPTEIMAPECPNYYYGVWPDDCDLFSIGCIAVYNIPHDGRVQPRPYPCKSLPRQPLSPHPVTGFTVVAPSFSRFIPANASQGGGTTVTASQFEDPARYQVVGRSHPQSTFLPGHTIIAALPDGNPVGGPAIIPPTEASRTATNQFLANSTPPVPLARVIAETAPTNTPEISAEAVADHARADVGVLRLPPPTEAKAVIPPSKSNTAATNSSGGASAAVSGTDDLTNQDDIVIFYGGIYVPIGSRLGAALERPAESNASLQRVLASNATISEIRYSGRPISGRYGHGGGHSNSPSGGSAYDPSDDADIGTTDNSSSGSRGNSSDSGDGGHVDATSSDHGDSGSAGGVVRGK